MAHLSLALLGPVQIRLDGAPVTAFESDKVRALLAYLALEAERPHRRAALAGLLWPERPERAAHLSLNQALSNLRHAIGDRSATAPVLRITPETIQFDRDSDHTLDVAVFSDLLAACDQHPHRHGETCTSCARRLQQAAELYRGSLLDQFFLSDSAAFEEWALLTRERLHRRAFTALAQLATYHERRGEHALAEHTTRRQLDLDPWREASHRQLMRLLACGGQRNAALMQYATCRRVLAKELDVEPEEETTALYVRIQRGADVASHDAVRPAANLAAHTPPTPLIGRETELAQLADRLEQRDCRLLTLVGPGGIGKTRLALQAAADLGASFLDGVAFVPLAALSAAELLVPAIAGALGFTFQGPADPKAQLLAYLRTKDMLLVLDNFEHLLAAAPLVSELLAACPDLAVLATSRAPLHVHGERQFPVPPLQLPDLAQLPDVARLTQYAAVALFVARAQAVQPAFYMTAVTGPTVATICARLNGLPLAIELAAARVKLFPPQALLARLGSRLKLLTGGARDLPERQQTIRSSIDWSYQLLDEDEQRLFARLGVFVGGWTLEAAEAVAPWNVATLEPSNVLDGIAALVDQSLVQQIEGLDDEPRFVMLETIREYALERLVERGDADAIGQQHAVYFLKFAEKHDPWPRLHAPPQEHWLARLDAEHENLRAASGCFAEQGEAECGVRLAGALVGFWADRFHWDEGRAWLEAALTRSGTVSVATRAKAVLGTAWLAGRLGDVITARANVEEGLALFRRLSDKAAVALALLMLGDIALSKGEYTLGHACLEECLALFHEVSDPWGRALAVRLLGDIALVQGDVAQAAIYYEEILTSFRQSGDKRGIGEFLIDKGCLAQLQGEWEQAVACYAESLAIFRELGAKEMTATDLHNLGGAVLHQGDARRAAACFAEGLVLSREVGSPYTIARNLAGMAGVAAAQGYPERSARLFGAAEALFDTVGIVVGAVDRAEYDRNLATIRAQLDDATFAAAWAAGQALPLEQAIAEALQAAA